MTDYRAQFNADVTFLNGGGLQAQEFRLDVSEQISESGIAELFVRHHLTGLGQAPISGARLHAAPVRVRDFGTFPVRAYAVIAGD